MSVIEVKGLRKIFKIAERNPGLIGAFRGLFSRKYKYVKALDGIDFSVSKGELVGYIGPNGAGKSTTIKILSGILVPEEGEVSVIGCNPWNDRRQYVGKIGVVFGQRTQLWWDLPVIESFQLLKAIYRIDSTTYNTNLDELIGTLDISDILNTPVRQLSLGQRMRCDLAASLLHSPEILFLDEPTIGLDAVAKLAVRSFVKKLKEEKKTTVILTTHDMDDIEALCNRVIMIANGMILFDGSISALRDQVKKERRLVVELHEAVKIERVQSVTAVKIIGNRVYLNFNPDDISAAKLINQLTSKYQIKDILIENPPIEEVVAQLYKEIGT